METKLVSQWNIDKAVAENLNLTKTYEQFCDEYFNSEVKSFTNGDKNSQISGGELLELLNGEFKKVESELNGERWVEFTNDIYFDKKAKGCWVIKEEGSPLYEEFYSHNSLLEVNDHLNKVLQDPLNQWQIPSEYQLMSLIPLSDFLPLRPFADYPILFSKQGKVQGLYCDDSYSENDEYGCGLPFLNLKIKNITPRNIFIKFIQKGLTPKKLNDSSDYQMLLAIFHRKNEAFKKRSNSVEKLKLAEDFLQKEKKATQDKAVITCLLNEDHIRADITPYHQKMVEDTDQGHWSLWQNELDTTGIQPVELKTPLVARDPKSSINDGVVGIDFGTKSTVVVYQKDNVNIHPMRIGTGDLSKEIDVSHYENPTIMEFNDLERFISDYQSKANKPNTRWQDLTISHTAQNSMLGCKSSQFNTFLAELKQWAGDKNRKLKIVGKQGKVIDLPPFLELKDDDFNPIEIYAYYLGLYINNQNNGLFLNYILSFPVTYELPIRDKIIESFEKGIQKSLPAELGSDTLAKLKVIKGASEPAAYALVALQAFEFDPCGDERIFYSVFDFGGGTTDFDFGIFRDANGAKERRFDHVIEHFGAGGDRYLGGENLLELLAFEIFKKNKKELLAKKIQFEKHPEQDTFAGGEQLLSSSQEAKINTKSLCKALRPFWEEQTEDTLDLSQGVISLSLTDMDAKMHATFELNVDENELNKILHDRIERGVINFFDALRLAFSNSKISLQDIDSIKIFLAGNSSQSHFVKDIFDKQIALQLEEMGRSENETSLFELFPPLGADKNDVEKPTGKTGVAFGLIESRPGGRIKVIDNNLLQDDIRFKFYLGENRKGKFKAILDREMPYQQWVEYIDASELDFEFFYTDQPNASSGKMAINDITIKKTMIELDITDDEAMVYLRVVSPSKIEYVVAHQDDIGQEQYLNQIKSIELSL